MEIEQASDKVVGASWRRYPRIVQQANSIQRIKNKRPEHSTSVARRCNKSLPEQIYRIRREFKQINETG